MRRRKVERTPCSSRASTPSSTPSSAEDEALDRKAMRRQVELMIGCGVSGITVLGLATEVAKLTEGERHDAVAWAAEDVAKRVPLSVTVFGNSVPEQTALVRAAEGAGADWLILQPPMVGSYGAAEFIRFYGRVAATTDLPVAIQNAPQLMGRGLAPEEVAALVRQHPNITHLKGEMPVVDIARAIEMTQGRLTVLNGQGGLEILDNLRRAAPALSSPPTSLTTARRSSRLGRPATRRAPKRSMQRRCPASSSSCAPSSTSSSTASVSWGAARGLPIHGPAPIGIRPCLRLGRRGALRGDVGTVWRGERALGEAIGGLTALFYRRARLLAAANLSQRQGPLRMRRLSLLTRETFPAD